MQSHQPLQSRDLGEHTLIDPQGGRYQGYRTHYKWDLGLTLRDWRYVVRIATISSVDPPEGSIYAQQCALFYPQAMGELLESHPWGFVTRWVQLALLADPHPGFAGVFALPDDCLKVWAVREHPEGPLIDFERQAGAADTVLCTQTATCHALYTRMTRIPQLLPPLFKSALAHLLASMLAGSIIKGDTGAAAAKSLCHGPIPMDSSMREHPPSITHQS